MRYLARRVRGIAIVTAIFILVVVAGLGAFIVSIFASQQLGSALDVQGVQAYQAARAGIDWGLYQRLRGPWVPTAQPTPPLLANDPCSTTQIGSFSFPPAASILSEFTVTVACAATVDTANSGPTVAILTATACSQPIAGWTATTTACPNPAPGNFYIERRLEVSF